jgi:hypothetical protein
MNADIDKNWEEFLNPEILRPRLTQAALFIVAFELLKSTIVDRTRAFFNDGVDAKGNQSPEYARILPKNSSRVHASLDWLLEQGAIASEDLATFSDVKSCRNRLAHELVDVLSTGLPPEFDARFADLVTLLRKIEVWWIVEVDVPTNPEFDGQSVDEDGIVPGPIWGLQLIHEIVLGSPERSRFYYEEFRRRTRGPQAEASSPTTADTPSPARSRAIGSSGSWRTSKPK